MLNPQNAILVVVDVQEKLLKVMPESDQLLKNLVTLVSGMKVLDIPVLITEQYPKGLGPTVPEIVEIVPDVERISKLTFSCCQEPSFRMALASSGRKQVLLAGIEAHICVYQTAMELRDLGYQVEIVTDGVASRDPRNKELALRKMNYAGVGITGTEMALFELLQVAQGERFKQISKLVK